MSAMEGIFARAATGAALGQTGGETLWPTFSYGPLKGEKRHANPTGGPTAPDGTPRPLPKTRGRACLFMRQPFFHKGFTKINENHLFNLACCCGASSSSQVDSLRCCGSVHRSLIDRYTVETV